MTNWLLTLKYLFGFSLFWFFVTPIYMLADRLMGEHVWSIASSVRLVVANSEILPFGYGLITAVLLGGISVFFIKLYSLLSDQFPKYDLGILYCLLMTASTIYRADVVWEYHLTASLLLLSAHVLHLSSWLRSTLLVVLLIVAI